MALPGPLTLTSTRFQVAPPVPRLKYPVFSEEPCSAKSLLSETALPTSRPDPDIADDRHRYGGYTSGCSDITARKRRTAVALDADVASRRLRRADRALIHSRIAAVHYLESETRATARRRGFE